MSVALLGSPENRRVLRATAIADGIVDAADVSPGWTVSVGGPIYRQILPLSSFATGSTAWMTEMRALAGVHPAGGPGVDVEPPIEPPTLHGPYDADGLEYWVQDYLIWFEIGDGDDTPDVWVTEEQMLAMDITGEQKALIQAILGELDC